MASFEYQALDSRRFLNWDLLAMTRDFVLTHHIVQVDFSSVDRFRRNHEQRSGRKPTYLICTLFALAQVLKRYPTFNSYIRSFPVSKLVVFDEIDLGVTVEKQDRSGRFVFFEILRDAGRKNLDEFLDFQDTVRSKTLKDYRKRRKFSTALRVLPRPLRLLLFKMFVASSPESIRRMFGTTTLTSIGKFGTDMTAFSAPRTVTFALGRIGPRPLVKGGLVLAPQTGYVSLVYDLRVLNGFETARFCRDLTEFLEDFESHVQV